MRRATSIMNIVLSLLIAMFRLRLLCYLRRKIDKHSISYGALLLMHLIATYFLIGRKIYIVRHWI